MGMQIHGSILTPIGNVVQTRKHLNKGQRYLIASCYEGDVPRVLRGRRGIFISLPEESPAAVVYVGNKHIEVGAGIPVCTGSGHFLPVAIGDGDLWMIADNDCWANILEWTE